MWLFWLFEILALIAVFVLIFLYCHWFKKRFWSFLKQYLKWIALVILAVWLLIAVLCWHHLYDATFCYFRGVSMKANTKYSLFLGECQIETPSGAYVPVQRTRALPGNSEHHDDYQDYGYN